MRPLNQDHEEVTPESPNLPGHGTENLEDEANILADQDETMLVNAADNDVNMGADGTDEDYGLDPAEFARGEIDVKEQMDRTTENMNAKLHRPRDPNSTPHSPEGQIDTTATLQDSMKVVPSKH